MGVDHTTYLDPAGTGRKSVRIMSQKSWTHGLFIADILHMPGGTCGTWPACKYQRINAEKIVIDDPKNSLVAWPRLAEYWVFLLPR